MAMGWCRCEFFYASYRQYIAKTHTYLCTCALIHLIFHNLLHDRFSIKFSYTDLPLPTSLILHILLETINTSYYTSSELLTTFHSNLHRLFVVHLRLFTLYITVDLGVLIRLGARAAEFTRVFQSTHIILTTLVNLAWNMAGEVWIVIFDAAACYKVSHGQQGTVISGEEAWVRNLPITPTSPIATAA
jgi:hypothetical protein